MFAEVRLLPEWPRFLDDFQRHWPTDNDHTYVDFVRDGAAGNGAKRMGNVLVAKMCVRLVDDKANHAYTHRINAK